jgi:hypothetical protein
MLPFTIPVAPIPPPSRFAAGALLPSMRIPSTIEPSGRTTPVLIPEIDPFRTTNPCNTCRPSPRCAAIAVPKLDPLIVKPARSTVTESVAMVRQAVLGAPVKVRLFTSVTSPAYRSFDISRSLSGLLVASPVRTHQAEEQGSMLQGRAQTGKWLLVSCCSSTLVLVNKIGRLGHPAPESVQNGVRQSRDEGVTLDPSRRERNNKYG